MLDHFIITVSDVNKSKKFYSEVLATLNYEQKNDFGTSISFGDAETTGSFFGYPRDSLAIHTLPF